jgi:hypothetical protein
MSFLTLFVFSVKLRVRLGAENFKMGGSGNVYAFSVVFVVELRLP